VWRSATSSEPSVCGGAGPSAAWPLLDDVPHRLRRGSWHLTPRRSQPDQAGSHHGLLAVLLAGALGLGLGAPAAARVFLTVDEALALAFPGAAVERRTAYLTADELAAARRLAGVEVASALVHPYVATSGGAEVGTAYFDTHRVRTLPETLMVVVDPQGKLVRVEVLSFDEPADYLPPKPWYAQFDGHRLTEGLALEREVRGVSGASLSARATTEAVRRVLAIDAVLQGREEK
jgi:FMN-binding domain